MNDGLGDRSQEMNRRPWNKNNVALKEKIMSSRSKSSCDGKLLKQIPVCYSVKRTHLEAPMNAVPGSSDIRSNRMYSRNQRNQSNKHFRSRSLMRKAPVKKLRFRNREPSRIS